MAKKSYFNFIPDFDYVSRLPKSQSISDYLRVKNLFKRTKISQTIFQDLTYFTKYQIIADERPDNIAFKIYGDSNLDWMIMLANNITNLQDEWPLEETAFYKFLLNKYVSEAGMETVHHYETQKVTDSMDRVIVPKGLKVPSNYSVTYFDSGTGTEKIANVITDEVSLTPEFTWNGIDMAAGYQISVSNDGDLKLILFIFLILMIFTHKKNIHNR